MNINKSEIVTF